MYLIFNVYELRDVLILMDSFDCFLNLPFSQD